MNEWWNAWGWQLAPYGLLLVFLLVVLALATPYYRINWRLLASERWPGRSCRRWVIRIGAVGLGIWSVWFARRPQTDESELLPLVLGIMGAALLVILNELSNGRRDAV